MTTPVPIHIGADRLTVAERQSCLPAAPARTAAVPRWRPASLTFGRLDFRSACHCAVDARYSNPPLRVAAFRRSSREIVEGARSMRRAISRTPNFWACKQRDLFAFSKGQVAPRQRRQVRRWHAAILAEPPRADRLRYAGFECGIPTRQPARDGLPEPLSMFTASRRRTTWRTDRASPRASRPTSFRSTHCNFSS